MIANEIKLRDALAFRRLHRDAVPALDRPTYYCATPDDHLLPEPLPVERVKIGGLLALAWATVWCRKDSLAPSASPVPWDKSAVHPWVVELHGVWPEALGVSEERVGVAFRLPCPVDPRESSPKADAAIRTLVARALLHEGQGGLHLDGERLDPHEHGEVGLSYLWHLHLARGGR